MKRAALFLLLAAAACDPAGTANDIVDISIDGTVTLGGSPAAGAVIEIYRPNVQGLPQLAGMMTTGAAGTYDLATTIEQFRCILVYVEVELANPGGGLPHSGRGNAVACGANTLDFAF